MTNEIAQGGITKCQCCDGKGGWVVGEWTDPVSGPECEVERCTDCDGTGFEVRAAATPGDAAKDGQ